MANLRIQWTLPSTRESGKPLNPADIDHVLVELSADLGSNWSEVGAFLPDVLETTVQDVDFGEWYVRASVHDNKGRVSQYAEASITNEDTTAPSAPGLTLTFV